ncbi:MAG TPA: AMIN domain-containing protein [Verrucomicrobiae bacterium]|jgi:Tfp pilus assembly protein PilP|nr:AMIN domain-containing protein [Verrucomicrobiae bacterium]
MKLTTGILAVVMITGAAWGQNPATIDNPRSDAKSLPQTQIKTNNPQPVLVAQAAKPAPGAPAAAVKPATIPGAAAAAAPAKAAAMPASVQSNTLQRVNVVRNADDIQIEIGSREAVTPKVSKLSSPARVVVELPATAMATTQSKIPVGSAGVKGVRIGMDGKTPPNTSVVVDLEQALTYELTPGPGNSFVLILHTQTAAKSTPAAAPKAQTVAVAKPVAAPAAATPAAKSKTAPAVAAAQPHDAFVAKKPAASAPVAVAKVEAPKPASTHAAPATAKATADEKAAAASVIGEAPKPPQADEKKWAMNGKRDPFFSPVVQQPTGSGCSTGKKCLEIGQINLRGVVKSEGGFIAVVTNTLNKAYFLHENDPVFNGYVMRITGDSVVFEETVQDKLGKPFTREVVKRISTPAV